MINYRYSIRYSIPMEARDYTGYDMDLKQGYSLWGTATGSVPHHRQWWIKDPNGTIWYLDQGCYENSRVAAQERVRWARQIGALLEYRQNVPDKTDPADSFTFDLEKLDMSTSNFTFDLEKLDT